MMMQLKKITIKGNKLILGDDKIIYLTKEMFSKFDFNDVSKVNDFSARYIKPNAEHLKDLRSKRHLCKKLRNNWV